MNFEEIDDTTRRPPKYLFYIKVYWIVCVQPGPYQMDSNLAEGTVSSLYFLPPTTELFAWNKEKQKVFKAK